MKILYVGDDLATPEQAKIFLKRGERLDVDSADSTEKGMELKNEEDYDLPKNAETIVDKAKKGPRKTLILLKRFEPFDRLVKRREEKWRWDRSFRMWSIVVEDEKSVTVLGLLLAKTLLEDYLGHIEIKNSEASKKRFNVMLKKAWRLMKV